jgi:hypothetical protein
MEYNNCHLVFKKYGFKEVDTHIYSSGFIVKTYTHKDVMISFYQDNESKGNEFIIQKGEREIVFIGKLLSEEFFKQLLESINYDKI